MKSNWEIKIKKRNILLAMGVLIIGLIMPIVLTHENFGIYTSIEKALENWDKEYLLIAIFKLILLNTLRAFPAYISMLILFDSIEIIVDKKNKTFYKIIMISLMLPIMYILIEIFYGINLLIGKTSILGILWFFYYTKIELKNLNFLEKTVGFLAFIIGLQWLDITPYLNFLRVGEITLDLNNAINFMEAQLIVIILCMSFFIFFTLVSILLLYFFKCQEEIINRRYSEVENRYLKELQQLVHDLKTPIFAVSALLEVLRYNEEVEKNIEYIGRIENSIDKLNLMIGDMVNLKNNSFIFIEEVMNFSFSFLSAHKNANKLVYKNYANKNCKVFGNRSLLSRVITNLVINSWEANSEKVEIIVKNHLNKIIITVEDFGSGIKKKDLDKLIIEGVSTKNSSGKGLAFVKKVIEESNGIFYIRPKKIGIKVYIVLKGEV